MILLIKPASQLIKACEPVDQTSQPVDQTSNGQAGPVWPLL
jgi:hypothetical protein